MVEPLGAQLHAAGIVTRAEVAEAEPAHAGTPTRFVRRLLSSTLSEAALAGFFVARGAGSAIRKEDFERAPASVTGSLRGEMARALCALPVMLHGTELEVAMLVPWDEHAVSEIARATGKTVRPRVALLTELQEAIAQRHPMTNSAQRMPAEMGAEEPVLELVNRRRGPTNRSHSEDMNDAVPLVRKKPVSKSAPPPQRTFERPHESHAPTSRLSATAEYDLADISTRSSEVGTARAGKTADVPKSADLPKSLNVRKNVHIDSSGHPPESHPLDSWGPLSESKPPPALATADARPLPDIGPALAALRSASDRDELIRETTRAIAEVAHGAVLLAVRHDVLKGWDGAGPGVSPEAIRNLWIPVRSPGLLRRVVESGEPYRGPHGDSAADQLFRAAIAGGQGTLVVEGIRVAGRVVALICADDVRGASAGAERVAMLAQATGQALERLLRNKKRGA